MRRVVSVWSVLVVLSLAVAACGQSSPKTDGPVLKELQRVKAGNLDVVLLSPSDQITHGKDTFVLEFQEGGNLRDVGTVKANATMPMAGMPPMFGTLELQPAGAPGRYSVASELSMAGTWQINVEWQGPAGNGSTTLHGAVR
jgi:hypothetical protein